MYMCPEEIEDHDRAAAILGEIDIWFVCSRDHLPIHRIREREGIIGKRVKLWLDGTKWTTRLDVPADDRPPNGKSR